MKQYVFHKKNHKEKKYVFHKTNHKEGNNMRFIKIQITKLKQYVFHFNTNHKEETICVYSSTNNKVETICFSL